MESPENEIAVQSNEGAFVVRTTLGVDVGERQSFLKQVRRYFHALDATAQIELLAQIGALTIVELKIDVRIAADATFHRLFRNLDGTVRQEQSNIVLTDHGG